jgi:hypothetical protein
LLLPPELVVDVDVVVFGFGDCSARGFLEQFTTVLCDEFVVVDEVPSDEVVVIVWSRLRTIFWRLLLQPLVV